VDYGNEEMIDVNKVRKPLKDKLFKLPFQVSRERGREKQYLGEKLCMVLPTITHSQAASVFHSSNLH